jgi:hypothetical protein
MKPPQDPAVRQLLELPLMGVGLARAEHLLESLDRSQLSPVDAWHVQTVEGRILARQGAERAVDVLADAGQEASLAGDRTEEVRLALWTAGALAACGRGDAARALVAEVLDVARTNPALGFEWRLAESRCGHPDARQLALDAISHIPSPARDADRFDAWQLAGVQSMDGGDQLGAARAWQEAATLARRHGARADLLPVATLLAHLRLQTGQVRQASELLVEATSIAADVGDDLTLAAEGSILAAIQLEEQDWQAAAGTARLASAAALRRGNWMGFVDASITIAACLDQLGARSDALFELLTAAGRARSAGAEAAVNIVRARLGELRAELGAEAFDAPFQEAVARLGTT